MIPRPFEALTHQGRLRRYRAFAAEAVKRWALPVDRIRSLKHGENFTYRVDAGGASYLLRIQRPDRRTGPEIRSELCWLQALRAKLGCVVPEPVPHSDGLLGEGLMKGAGHRHFVLFRWVHGRFRHAWPSPAPLERAGALLARIHRHGRAFPRPEHFRRPTWSLETLCHGDPGCGSWGDIDPAHRPVYLEARDRILEAGDRLGPDSRHGLIHGDFHHGNYLFRKRGLAAIDFDECGFGPRSHDIATALIWFRLSGRGAEATRLFMKGYASVTTPPGDFASEFELYTMARMLYMVLWRAGRPEHPEFTRWMEVLVPRAAGRVRRWLDGGDPFQPEA